MTRVSTCMHLIKTHCLYNTQSKFKSAFPQAT